MWHHTRTLQDSPDQGVHQAVNSQRTTGVPGNGEFLSPFCSIGSSYSAAPVPSYCRKTETAAVDGGKHISIRTYKGSLIASAILLAYPQANAPISVTVDASSVAVGAAPEQLLDDSWQPLAFFSKALRPAEKKYSTFDREFLAVYLVVRHFRYYLE